MATRQIITAGTRFGRLIVIRDLPGCPHKVECDCECGTRKTFILQNLKHRPGRVATTSCGCARVEVTIARNLKHGMAKTPEHRIWCGMTRRCYCTTSKSYPIYGGRGIRVSKMWRSFAQFYKDMGPRPSPMHTIERIDTNGNYTAKNCKWATRKEQNRNTRSNTRITIKGETKCLAEWDEVFAASGALRIGQFKDTYHRKGLDAAIQRAVPNG